MKGKRLKDVLAEDTLNIDFWNKVFAKMNTLLVRIESTNPSIDDTNLRWVSDRIEYFNSEERISIPFFFEPNYNFVLNPAYLNIKKKSIYKVTNYETFLDHSLKKFIEYNR